MTFEGGAYDCGAFFELARPGGAWTETVLYDFKGGSDGCEPHSLRRDANGVFYGATALGGQAGSGTVYQLSQEGGTWTETVIYSFRGGTDGRSTMDLELDSAGSLYGVTEQGGKNDGGIAFELTQSGGKWNETILHNFAGLGNGNDGSIPVGILLDRNTGALYVTTQHGGTGEGVYGGGTAVELTQSGDTWTENILHNFGDRHDGRYPFGRLIQDKNTGVLYGTTSQGGIYRRSRGTVYEISIQPALHIQK